MTILDKKGEMTMQGRTGFNGKIKTLYEVGNPGFPGIIRRELAFKDFEKDGGQGWTSLDIPISPGDVVCVFTPVKTLP